MPRDIPRNEWPGGYLTADEPCSVCKEHYKVRKGIDVSANAEYGVTTNETETEGRQAIDCRPDDYPPYDETGEKPK